MRFFIQQVAQTLDDVLMGISSFFVFVFRQSFAFLSSQFSCFIETWATNKRAGWLFCERKFHYSSFIGIILYRDQNFDDWNFHLFVNPSYWGRSPKMESAWPPTARFGGGGGGVCRLLYWNPGWLTWASIIYSGWKINTSGVSSWFANWKLVSYLYTYIYVKNTQHTHVYIYIYMYITWLGSFYHREPGSEFYSWPVCPMFLGGFEARTDEGLARLLQVLTSHHHDIFGWPKRT